MDMVRPLLFDTKLADKHNDANLGKGLINSAIASMKIENNELYGHVMEAPRYLATIKDTFKMASALET
ncbi:MAG: hypothetical protein GY861_13035, partial [bacterium]|nr:hypothetical protein [bacterium]